MTRCKQGDVVSPRELLKMSKDQKNQAKWTAVELVEKALASHILSTHDSNNFISAVCKAISLDESELSKNRKKRIHSSTESSGIKETGSKKKGRSNSFDDHDEICEVCEKGGDLLCCDTCTLVFHLKCIRPKLSGIPKGSWSCPHCIIDDLADGDVRAAKSSIRLMNRLARGLDTDDDSSFTGATGPAEAPDPMRVGAVGEFLVVRKGKKFVLKQVQRKHVVDIGKYLSLEEALNYIKEGEFTAQKEAAEKAAIAAAALNKKKEKETALSSHGSSNSLSSRRRRGSPELLHADELPTERDDLSSNHSRKEGSAGEEVSKEGDAESSNGYDELWCTHCMDDKGVTVCVFCGCKKCYGKYDSSLLILCDHCERETHTYCLDPPLAAVPEEDPWYCHSCVVEGVPDMDSQAPDILSLGASGSDVDFGLFDPDMLAGVAAPKKRPWSSGSGASVGEWGEGLKKIRAMSESDGLRGGSKYQTKASLAANGQPLKQHRGRGRPPGSGKRALPTTTTTSLTLSSIHSLPDFSVPKAKVANAHNANNATEFKNKSRRSKSLGWDEGDFDFDDDDYGDFDLTSVGFGNSQDEVENELEADHEMAVVVDEEEEVEVVEEEAEEEVEEEEEVVVEEVFELGAVGIRAALQVIARASTVAGKVEGGPWTEPELDLLDQLRTWAPVCDLERAFAALQAQKELLVKRIQAQEPLFDCQDMEMEIAAQLAEARCAENALLSSSLAATDSAAVVAAAAAAVIAPAPMGISAAAVVPKPKRVSKPKPASTVKAAAADKSGDRPPPKRAVAAVAAIVQQPQVSSVPLMAALANVLPPSAHPTTEGVSQFNLSTVTTPLSSVQENFNAVTSHNTIAHSTAV